MKKLFLFVSLALVVWACSPDNEPLVQRQTEWMERVPGFQDKYELEQLLVFSRHNIRTPLVGKGSVLSRVTDPQNQWFPWQDPAGHLTAKGQRLEAIMGSFFREWLSKKDFLDKYSAHPSTFRFYANAKQRCQLTARTFAEALFPGNPPEVEMHVAFDTMDPVFTPKFTKLPAGFVEKAQQEIAERVEDDINAGIAAQYSLIERVIGITGAPAYPDTTSFSQFPSYVGFTLDEEPFMNGGLKMACTVSDALVLQYYEEPDEKKAAFGQMLTPNDWKNVSLVKDWYGDALFTAPSIAVNVAHPLLQTMLAELQQSGRVFTFLCGHDSNIGSVLAALETEEYDLPETIENRTPIGSKIIIEKFKAKDGSQYADCWLVYASTSQIRSESAITYAQPPVAVRLRLHGLSENADRLYKLSDVEQRFTKAIAAYDSL